MKKYFGDATEKQILVQGMVEAGEIKKEEAWDILTQMTNMRGVNFYTFLKELQETLGCKVIKGTMVNRIEKRSAF
jgi:NAD(P)H-nitrite reductase large subunit